jgi:hypothetical protein
MTLPKTSSKKVLARLADDWRGVSLVEFALISPALLMIFFGVFDLAYQLYATTQLEGSVYRAARSSSIEGGEPIAMDLRVTRAVHQIVPGATVQIRRRVYTDFSEVAQPEDFTDLDNDGLCSEGEPFEDVNGNGQWDSDRGRSGQGGARDAVLYQVRVSYKRPFPAAAFIGMEPTVTASTRTVLRNQPYGRQQRTITVGNCT